MSAAADKSPLEKRLQLAALRAQVVALEAELAADKATAPPAPSMPDAPPFEHVEYHQHKGNLGPDGLG